MNLQRITEFIEKSFIAVTFAEANCHEMIDYGTQETEEMDTIETFLKNVGLQNARVSYCMMEA